MRLGRPIGMCVATGLFGTWFAAPALAQTVLPSTRIAVEPPAKTVTAGMQNRDTQKNGGQKPTTKPEPPPQTILKEGEAPIDLGTALRLAGSENPELLLARERISEAMAQRMLAAAEILPNLNVGGNYDLHRGVLQQSNGNILDVHRDALYLGLGANAVGSGTVSIPGLNYNLNVGEAWYRYLIARQIAETTGIVSVAVRNDVLFRVVMAYLDLLQAEGRRSIVTRIREEAAEIARVTKVFAQKEQGKLSDADRAAVEVRQRAAELTQAESDVLTASARLAQLLNLDPSIRLKPVDGWVVPAPIVPDPIPLTELIAIALMERPELAARRSDVQTSLYELSLARVLPFSPHVIAGLSTGRFGGGSNLVSSPGGFVSSTGQRQQGPRFGNFDDRTDFDVVVFWTFRNLGVGNIALAQSASSRVRQMRLRELETLNAVRADVAAAHALVHARYQQIEDSEKAVRSAEEAYSLDLKRIKAFQGLPLELMDSLRLMARSRTNYLDAIIGYNRAQVQLWVALGRPPANVLARPIPADLVPPPTGKQSNSGAGAPGQSKSGAGPTAAPAPLPVSKFVPAGMRP